MPIRRRLGVSAFGVNAYRAGSVGGTVVEEHVESPGQEELYVVVRGHASLAVDGEEVDAPAGTAVFVPRPDSRRSGTALAEDTVVLAVGGWRGEAYRSLPWEPIYLAQEPMRRGDWAAAAATLRREAGEHLDTGIVRYRLACCHARLGEHEVALDELRRAIEANPKLRDRAAADEHLAPLRELEDWPA